MITDPLKLRRNLTWLAVFALPIGVVQISGWISGRGASPIAASAAASQESNNKVTRESVARLVMMTDRIAHSDAEHAAIQRSNELENEPFGPTPMLHRVMPEHSSTQDVVEYVQFPALNPVPQFTLQAIMSGTSEYEARALINDRLFTIGQAIDSSDWFVTHINADARLVILAQSETGRNVTIRLQTP